MVELDPRTGAPLGSFAVGNGPSAVAVGPGAVWVANRTDGTVSRIDPETGVAETQRVGGAPSALVADERGVWVANSGDQTVVHVDSRTLTNTAPVRVGSTPAGLTLVDGEVWTATAEAPAAHRGGTLRVSQGGGGGPVDPIFGGPVHGLAYDGLVGYRRAGGAAGGTLVAGLATTVPDAGPDGLTYRFRLRPNVRFSNGAPVTPRDVRASVERMLVLGDPEGNDDLTAIRGAKRCTRTGCDLSDGIEIDQAARTVTLHLSRPDPEFLHKLHRRVHHAGEQPAQAHDHDAPAGHRAVHDRSLGPETRRAARAQPALPRVVAGPAGWLPGPHRGPIRLLGRAKSPPWSAARPTSR